MENLEFLIKHCENLENEIKRIKKELKNTIKINVKFNNKSYLVDTQIIQKFKENQISYLADSYNQPSKVKILRYVVGNSFLDDLIIYCEVFNFTTKKFENYFEESLFSSKDSASMAYLKNKERTNGKY